MLYAIVAVLVILADQMIKLYVSSGDFHAMNLIPGVLNLTKVENTGGAFGLLGGEIPTYWFIVIAVVFTILVIIALATRFVNGFLARWSLVLVTAGGVSNCIDRVINVRPTGHVVDMFQFDFWQKFPVFNLADVFISVFCIIFIFAILFGRSPKDKDEYEDEFVEDEEEELEEEEEEVRPSRKARKARKAAAEEEDEEELPAPKPSRSSRKARQAKYDEEYEQYKAEQHAREEAQRAAAQPAPVPAAVVENPTYNPEDPFAEWERANTVEQPAPAPVVEPAPVAPAPRPVAAPVEPVQEEPVPAPAPRPARRPAPAPVVEEPSSFSLDDILAEFK